MDQIKLYNILRSDLHLTDDKAADFVSAIGKSAERELNARIQSLATKDDIKELRTDLRDIYRTIYLSGLAQFIAIVASVLAIIKFMR